MKKTLRFKARQVAEVEEEVEFPIYARHDLDGDGWSCTIFMRRDEDGTTYSIKQEVDSLEVEIRRSSFDGSHADYVLGRGEYQSSADEFNEALQKARKFLARVPAP